MKIFGQHDAGTLAQFDDVRSRAVDAALMADGHVGYVMPIGGVAAYREQVSVVGVGFDIACGCAAIRTDLTLAALGDTPEEIRTHLAGIADDVAATVSFGVGRRNTDEDAPVDHPLFDDAAWSAVPTKERNHLRNKARAQLGTVGSGNHYVDVFVDERDAIWVGVHFGSRGFGHTVASAFLALGQGGKWGERVPEREVLLDLASPVGHDYWHLMNLAGRYAYAGREWVARRVVEILGARELELVHNHHNFCIPGDGVVPTPSGPKRMADVRPGDVIYAFDPLRGLVESPVLRQWRSGVRRIRTIRTASRRLRVSDDHPVLVITRETGAHPTRPWHGRTVGALRWVRADAVAVGDIVVCAEGYYRRDGGGGAERARLIGAMLGDGWLRHDPRRSGYSVGLAIGAADEAHTARYRELLEAALPPARWRSDAPGTFGLTCSSAGVWRAVDALGLGGYGHEKRVPAWAFALPVEEKLALLAGYMDADGSIAGPRTSNHGRGTIASTNEALVEDLRELAIGCGLRVTSVRSENRQTNFGRAVVHRCVLSCDAVARLELWHASKSRNVRTARFARPQGLTAGNIGYLVLPDGAFAQRVRSVEVSVVEEPVYDLTVADPGHAFVCDGVVVHNCWKERHVVDGPDGRGETELCVVRKGATPAFPGQLGFVGGSMGDDAVIVRGVASPDPALADVQRAALHSTVHGAGRVMSRTQAAGKRNRRTGAVIKPGLVSREMMHEWLAGKGVILRGGGLDESPHAYRRLPDVLAAQEGTVEVVHTLRPLIVVMAGENEFDPYKD